MTTPVPGISRPRASSRRVSAGPNDPSWKPDVRWIVASCLASGVQAVTMSTFPSGWL